MENGNRNLLSTSIAEQINEMILRQKMKPGTKLPSESQLAQTFGVSRPTVREAMKTLKAQNIITIRQGDGTYVNDFTGLSEDPLGFTGIERVTLTEDIFETRLLMEPEIAMIAAQRATDEEIEELYRIALQMQEMPYKDPNRSLLDCKFHTLIAKCAKNSVFSLLMPVIYDTIQNGVIILYESEESHRKAQHAHMEICRAFQRRDGYGAKNAVASHIYVTLDDIRIAKRKAETSHEQNA